MNKQELSIKELESRLELSASAEDPCVDPDTYTLDHLEGYH